jgi:hypothetical protein
VKKHTCQVVSKEELVVYVDGDLSASRSERIAEHIANCPNCRSMAEALQRSLQVTQVIWQTSESQWPETHSFGRIVPNRRPLKKLFAVAASILFVLGAGAIWRLLSEPSERIDLTSEETKVAELRLKIADSGDAARLLAAAELLSKYPRAKSSVEQRYRHIVETYPETAAAVEARLRTQ